MKSVLVSFFVFLSITIIKPQSCGGGELYFKIINSSTMKFDLEITSDQYGWLWDGTKPLYNGLYDTVTFSDKQCVPFTNAKSGGAETQIPWGFYKIKMTVKDQNNNIILTRNFYLDIRDENWGHYGDTNYVPSYPGVDTFIEYNASDGKITISARQNGVNEIFTVLENHTFTIWSIWDIPSPHQSRFTIPVTLKNRIENEPSVNFGSLLAKGSQVPSGSAAYFQFNIVNNVSHYTVDTYYDSTRKYSFKWLPNQINPNVGANIYSGSLDFTIPITQLPKDITRNFKTIYPLTIKTVLTEAGSSYPSKVKFKDPTTDNNLNDIIINQDGYIKNEAFKELNEIINFQPNQKYAVKAISPIILGTRNYYWYSGDFNPSSALDLTLTDTTVLNAYYKGSQISTSPSAFANNSQKKIVRTTDGTLHSVYESIGHVWYEKSTDNGTTWTIQNNCRPLSTNEAKLPSIDYSGTSYIFIVWQEKYDATFKIRSAHIQFPTTQVVISDVYSGGVGQKPYSHNAAPVVAWANNKMLVVWNEDGLVYRFGTLDCYSPINWHNSQYGTLITGTDASSINPTLVIRKDGGATVFHLGWQQYSNSIKYSTLTPDASNNIIVSSAEYPSTGSGFTYNTNPSISIKSDGYPTLVWIGNNTSNQVTRRTKTSTGWSATFGKYGTNTESPTEYNGIVAWSENNANKVYRPWGSILTLGTVGKYMQVTTGSTMYAVAHRHVSPYDFQISPELTSIPKSSLLISQSGREGIITKGTSEFYFVLADVTVDNNSIGFTDTDNNSTIDSKKLDQLMTTNSFVLNKESKFTFNIAFGVTDSVNALKELSDSKKELSLIEYNIELVDAKTNEVLGKIDRVIIDENNVYKYENRSYEVNAEGLENRSINLRISSSIISGSDKISDVQYTLADIITEKEVLVKSNMKEVSFKGEAEITSYELMQNYPNPFNPVTNINYQLPQDGHVTLKIFDALGTEITTLVSEVKSAGKYNVNFDASGLASGVYFYQMKANDFSSTKKLMLMK